ncbi:hypothetical protein EON83_25910 [bacterium]|nr:MAG: hypothetical protein EON83_25910 [bacterium]
MYSSYSSTIDRYASVSYQANFDRIAEQVAQINSLHTRAAIQAAQAVSRINIQAIEETAKFARSVSLANARAVAKIAQAELTSSRLNIQAAEQSARTARWVSRINTQAATQAAEATLSFSRANAQVIARIAQAQLSVSSIVSNFVKRLADLPKFEVPILPNLEMIQRQMLDIRKSFYEPLKNLNFTWASPNFEYLRKNLKELIEIVTFAEAKEVLKEAGYEFLIQVLPQSAARKIAGFRATQSNGGLTRRLAKNTRSEMFALHMKAALQSCKRSRKWWGVTNQALVSHAQGNYGVSARTFFTVIEALLNECLYEEELAYFDGKSKSVVRKNANGKVAKDRNNKVITLNGLESKVQHLSKHSQRFKMLTDCIEAWLKEARNNILHGNIVGSNCRLSVQLVLIVFLGAYALSSDIPPITNIIFH